jgi:succinate dehydrogenase/fumarate reductase flavoprotein subunit
LADAGDRPADPEVQKTRLSGNGMMRSLEIAARRCGVEILLEHRMTRIYRQSPNAGPVLGIAVDRKGGRPIDIRARKAVIVGTGGSTGNVNFRRMFDPRLTEEYCGLAGMPWSDQDASGELWLNAALAGIDDGHNGGGPIWAIFDSDAVAREGWQPQPPQVDVAAGFFFSANRLADLADKIVMKYQRLPMPPAKLEETVARYNSFVESGVDADFDKPRPQHRIEKPPFYAAWATPVVHDTRAGLRINAACQVIDMNGEVIPGLYCGGESAGGFSQHGLARAACQGYIAGQAIAAQLSGRGP